MYMSFFQYLLSVFQILSSMDLTTAGDVFKLVMKYATLPSVLKCVLKGKPPSAAEDTPSSTISESGVNSSSAQLEV